MDSKDKKLENFLPSSLTPSPQEDDFVKNFLQIFEDILRNGELETQLEGEKDLKKKGLGRVINTLPLLFHPRFSFLFEEDDQSFLPSLDDSKGRGETQAGPRERFHEYFDVDIEDFLDWLASWIGLTLKENWGLAKKREVLARAIIPLFRMRGTKRGLEEYLRIYLREEDQFQIHDNLGGGFEVGKSKVGIDTIPGKERISSLFIIQIFLSSLDMTIIENIFELLDTEKPIHTRYITYFYGLKTMQIKTRSIIGESTFLWKK